MRRRVSLGKYYWGMAASVIMLLTGGWLVLAPFALGYQAHNTGSWTDMTQNDIWFGIGTVIVSLAALALFVRSLVAALRDAGVVRARPKPQPQTQPATPAPAVAANTAASAAPLPAPPAIQQQQLDLEQTMATLAAALAADLAERRKPDNEHIADAAGVRREQ